MANILLYIAFLCTFALGLILSALYMNSITLWNAIIGIVAGIISAAVATWGIIKFYLDKRIGDATFKQHVSDYEKNNEIFK